MAMAERGKGPFAAGKGWQLSSNGGEHDVVPVEDAAGNEFALVFARSCAGRDKTAAKARAQRIAESLNKTEGHPEGRG
jgi:hypothetical protein